MSLETICSQYPISKTIVSHIKSLHDVSNLVTSSNSLYYNLENAPIRKTLNIPDNVLLIEHEYCPKNHPANWNNIIISCGRMRTSMGNIYQHFISTPKENLEHIITIRLEMYDFYDSYEYYVLETLTDAFGTFVDELFRMCPNADTLEVYSVVGVHFFLIKKLKSPKIKKLKDVTLSSMIDYSQTNPEECEEVINELSGLEEIDVFVRDFELYSKPYYLPMFGSIIYQLSKKKNNKVVISGNVAAKHVYMFKNFISFLSLNGINIILKGQFLCHEPLFSDLAMDECFYNLYFTSNIISLSVNLWNMKIFELFFISLPSFKNLKTIKIDIKDQLFENILSIDSVDIYKCCFNSKLLGNIPEVEEFYLRIQNNEAIYENEEDYKKAVPIKNDAAKEILLHLKSSIKKLYLKGIPNMTTEMGNIVSTNCPNINELILSPVYTLDSTFVQNMKYLKFLLLKGIYRLNISKDVEIVIVSTKKDLLSKQIADATDSDSCNYFSIQFNRPLKVSLRNIVDGHLKYNVFLNDILSWNSYLQKMNENRRVF
uniref:F-box domain-containing protein n=1 Tax=Parastrongyloides trichosuri TaxID=131310 RepID=A0A0N4ZDD5_PARTI